MHTYRIKGATQDLLEHREAIQALIDTSGLRLTPNDVDAYLSAPGDVLLAYEGARLLALCVATHRCTKRLRFLGFLLVVVHPAARRRGLLGRLTTRYFIGQLPRVVWEALRYPRRPFVIFADVCNPISYRRLAFAPRLLPDLISGNPPEVKAEAQRLRAELAQALGLKDLDVASGLLRHGVGKPGDLADQDSRDYWTACWRTYVPEGYDLLVLIPAEWRDIVKMIPKLVALSV